MTVFNVLSTIVDSILIVDGSHLACPLQTSMVTTRKKKWNEKNEFDALLLFVLCTHAFKKKSYHLLLGAQVVIDTRASPLHWVDYENTFSTDRLLPRVQIH